MSLFYTATYIKSGRRLETDISSSGFITDVEHLRHFFLLEAFSAFGCF